MRATQRDEKAIARWPSEQWPALKKQARLERKALVFRDEAGIYLLPGRMRISNANQRRVDRDR